MKITKAWLKKRGACPDGRAWWEASGLTDHREIALQLLKEKQYPWANWMLVRLMKHKDQVRYAIRAGREVLPLFEKKHPDDKRPRIALDTAEKWLDGKATKEEVRAAAYAAHATYVAAHAADAAAAYAAYVAFAAGAAAFAADAAYAAYVADAAADAADAASAARDKFWTAQIKYGLKLIGGKP